MKLWDDILANFKPYHLNPPYPGTITEIRGFALPEDYRAFLAAHNGGCFTDHSQNEEKPFYLFSVEEILSGERYKRMAAGSVPSGRWRSPIRTSTGRS